MYFLKLTVLQKTGNCVNFVYVAKITTIEIPGKVGNSKLV